MANQKVTGIITSIKDDKKGVRVLDHWYTNKFKDDIEYKIGDIVEIYYYMKGQLRNYSSINKVEMSSLENERRKVQSNNKPNVIVDNRKYVDAGNSEDRVINFINGCKDMTYAKKKQILADGSLSKIFIKNFIDVSKIIGGKELL